MSRRQDNNGPTYAAGFFLFLLWMVIMFIAAGCTSAPSQHTYKAADGTLYLIEGSVVREIDAPPIGSTYSEYHAPDVLCARSGSRIICETIG